MFYSVEKNKRLADHFYHSNKIYLLLNATSSGAVKCILSRTSLSIKPEHTQWVCGEGTAGAHPHPQAPQGPGAHRLSLSRDPLLADPLNGGQDSTHGHYWIQSAGDETSPTAYYPEEQRETLYEGRSIRVHERNQVSGGIQSIRLYYFIVRWV